MKARCKHSVSFFNSYDNVTFTVIKNNEYDCKDYIEFMQVKDYNDYIYLFEPLNFKKYFYSDQELRKEKLNKIYESIL